MLSKALEKATVAVHQVASLVCIPAIALIIVVDVFCRYVLNAPVFWAQDVTTLLLLLVFFGAQPLAYAEGVHVRMELLYGRFAPGIRLIVDAFSNLVIALVSGLIAYRMIDELLDPFAAGDTHGFLKVPVAPFRIAVALIMAILIAEAIVRTVRAIRHHA